ncbi:MAG: phosphoglycerate kinase [Methanocorpusculum sp.]|jgi:phosphoglycerate kinase|uniref:phosphoglycerate kinase n=1 Tax=Methanocorpusculum sp. TaxID=2058474 RepID=UPI00271B28D2|nr:phosphoglycerate kinase [Methanocorpusculum sp.]MDO9522238.1 phosphoglycerate kinase [Methanocorpusculum sp.]
MKFGTLADIETRGKTVLVRVDFNSPIDPSSNTILDDKRFREHIPTLQALEDARVVVLAHQSRPGKKDFTTLAAHADKLERLLGMPVTYVDDIFGTCAKRAVRDAHPGDVVLLENVRFSAEENLNLKPEDGAKTHLVKKLASMADLFVYDAFGTAHRSQPTTTGLSYAMKTVAGLLMEKEVSMLSKVFTSAPKPVTFVLGGTKVDDSIAVAGNVLANKTADRVAIIGVVANVFYLAKGIDIGEPSRNLIHTLGYDGEVAKAKSILESYPDKILLPEYVAVKENDERKEYPIRMIPKDCPILDMGNDSIVQFSKELKNSGSIVFNGPAGVFEEAKFASGTFELLRAAANVNFSVCGGGHTAAVIEQLGLASQYSHLSTGGGACIEFLTGKKLPAIAALEESWKKFGN